MGSVKQGASLEERVAGRGTEKKKAARWEGKMKNRVERKTGQKE